MDESWPRKLAVDAGQPPFDFEVGSGSRSAVQGCGKNQSEAFPYPQGESRSDRPIGKAKEAFEKALEIPVKSDKVAFMHSKLQCAGYTRDRILQMEVQEREDLMKSIQNGKRYLYISVPDLLRYFHQYMGLSPDQIEAISKEHHNLSQRQSYTAKVVQIAAQGLVNYRYLKVPLSQNSNQYLEMLVWDRSQRDITSINPELHSKQDIDELTFPFISGLGRDRAEKLRCLNRYLHHVKEVPEEMIKALDKDRAARLGVTVRELLETNASRAARTRKGSVHSSGLQPNGQSTSFSPATSSPRDVEQSTYDVYGGSTYDAVPQEKETPDWQSHLEWPHQNQMYGQAQGEMQDHTQGQIGEERSSDRTMYPSQHHSYHPYGQNLFDFKLQQQQQNNDHLGGFIDPYVPYNSYGWQGMPPSLPISTEPPAYLNTPAPSDTKPYVDGLPQLPPTIYNPNSYWQDNYEYRPGGSGSTWR